MVFYFPMRRQNFRPQSPASRPRKVLRRALFEQLEQRQMLNSDWHNPARPVDVNNDLLVSPMDALLVINQLNADGAGTLSPRTNPLDAYVDTNGDGLLTPIDALLVINRLNSRVSPFESARIEGEAETAPAGFISIPFSKLPGTSGQIVNLDTTLSIGREEFNELGLFVTNDESGMVNGVSPSDPGYGQAVFSSASRQVLYSLQDVPTNARTRSLPAGAYLRVYVLQGMSDNGDPSMHLRVRETGTNKMRIGWEEQVAIVTGWVQVGDRGYDDAIVDVRIGEPVGGNAEPVIGAIANQTIDEQVPWSIQAHASDANLPNDTISYSLDTAPVGMAINASTGLVSWTPSEAQGPGNFEVVVRASDRAGAFDTESFFVTVLEVNLAPSLANLISANAAPGDTVTLTARGTDPDLPANTLRYSLGSTAPAGSFIDPITGAFIWNIPLNAATGQTVIPIKVTDNGSPTLSGTKSLIVNVTTGCSFAPTIFESGGTANQKGTVGIQGCSAVLREGNSFIVGIEQDFIVPATPSAIEFRFDDLTFDTTSSGLAKDAFEVAFVDQEGNSLVQNYLPARDSFFNITEGAQPLYRSGIVVDGNKITVGLTGIPTGTQGTLIVRLVNNDSDTNSSVRIADFRIVASTLAAGAPEAVTANATALRKSVSLSTTTRSSSTLPPPGPVSVRAGEVFVPPVAGESRSISPILKWKVDTFDVRPESSNVMMTPAVADLDLDGIPDIVFSTYRDSWNENGVLRAISGKDGRLLWTVDDVRYEVAGQSGVAVGDIDGDGKVEIVAAEESSTINGSLRLLAFEHDGTFKWRSPLIRGGVGWGSASLADLDHDGIPEIVIGSNVLNSSDGSIRWEGAGGRANQGFGSLSIVADLDMDGSPEVVTGSTAYRSDGTIYWSAGADGFPAIGNFDDDAFPEVVVVSSGTVRVVNHDGTPVWGPFAIPGGGEGGAPTIADFDGDGKAEIGVAGANQYSAFDTDGTLLWSSATQDGTSRQTGSSVFDFNGDGNAEVIYGDELFLRIFDGRDGNVLYELPKSSCTTFEEPVVVDVDADGHAEIVTVANTSCGYGSEHGIFVIGGENNDWSTTRQIWNQHSYHVTNISDDGSIPAHEANSWEIYNNYRRNQQPTGTLFGRPLLNASAANSRFAPGELVLISGNAIAQGNRADGSSNSIELVSIDGNPADQMDFAGGFLSLVAIQSGKNEFQIVATDSVGQTTSVTLTLWGVERPVDGIDFDSFSDTTDAFSGVYGRTSFDEVNKLLFVDLATRNDGTFEAQTPLLVGVKNITDPTVSVVGYDGFLPDGTPYFDYSSQVAGGRLAEGQISKAPSISFLNPNRTQFHYDLVFLSQVNQPPAIQTLPKIDAHPGKTYIYDVNATDPDADSLSYSLATSPAGMTIDAATGIISWQPKVSDLGTATVTLEVADGRGGKAVQNYVISVAPAPPNRPPVILSTPQSNSVSASDLSSPGRVVVAQDINTLSPSLAGQNETRFAVNAAKWLTNKDSGNLLLIESSQTDPRLFISPIVKDAFSSNGFTWTATTRTDFTFDEMSAYDAIFVGQTFIGGQSPSFVSNSDLIEYVSHGGGVYLHAGVYDFGEAEGWSVFLNSIGLSFAETSNGLYTPTPITQFHPLFEGVTELATGNGVPIIDLDPEDNLGAIILGDRDQGFYAAYSGRPKLDSEPVEFQYQLKAIDPDEDDLEYILISAPTGLSLNHSTGSIRWSPTTDQIGNHVVKVQVSDGRGGLAEQEFTICVHPDPTNHPPVIVSKAETQYSSGEYHYDVEAIDADSDTLSYSLVDSPTGMSIDRSSGLVTWTPGASFTEPSADVTVSVVEARGGVDTQTFTISLQPGLGSIRGNIYDRAASEVGRVYSAVDGFSSNENPNGSWVSGMLPAPSVGSNFTPFATKLDNTIAFAQPVAGWTADIRAAGIAGQYPILLFNPTAAPFVYNVEDLIIGPQQILMHPGPNGERSVNRFVAPVGGSYSVAATFDTLDLQHGTTDVHVLVNGTSLFDGIVSTSPVNVNLQSIVLETGDTIDFVVGDGGNGFLHDSTSLDATIAFESGKGRPLPSVTVYLDQNQNGSLDSNERTTHTDATGAYEFTGLAVGTYFVREVVPTSFAQVSPGIVASGEVLISNGSFENPAMSGGFVRIGAGADTITDWSVTGISVDVIPGEWVSSDGRQNIDLAGTPGPGGVVQNVSVVPGASYGLYFDLASHPVDQPIIKSLVVSVDGHVTPFQFDGRPFDAQNPGWRAESVFFVASSDKVEIEFTGLDFSNFGAAIDNVRLVQLSGAGFHTVHLEEGQTATERDFVNRATGGTSTNSAPVFASSSILQSSVGQTYISKVVASDPDSDPIIYTLPLAPAGMTIHPRLGVIAWVPGVDQVGNQTVIVQAADDHGNVAAQSFEITVSLSNVAPAITSSPLQTATAGVAYQSALLAQDADRDPLTFTLVSGPVGLSIKRSEVANPNSGTPDVSYSLTWTPTAAQIGEQTVVISVNDGRGSEDIQQFVVTVAATAANHAPTVQSKPRTQSVVGGGYAYLPQAKDPDGDVLQWSLTNKPTGMSIDPASGLVTWTPAGNQLGDHRVTLVADDGRGGTASQDYTLTISSQLQNSRPVILSNPPTAASSEGLYYYDVEAVDDDHDLVRYALDVAPRGMSIDPVRGTIRWQPEDDQFGENRVVVRVTDTLGASSTQSFAIEVRCGNLAPAITSVPPTRAVAQRTYLYPVRAQDAEQGILTYRLTSTVAGMSINAQTGVIRWQPTAAQIGTHQVVIEAVDPLGSIGKQTYNVVVVAATEPIDSNNPNGPTFGNRPPLITSTPKFNAVSGALYQYPVTTTDLDGDAVTLTLSSPPAGMSIDGQGVIRWTPSAATNGQFPIAIVAEDAHGAISTQAFVLSVSVNTPPRITSTPVISVAGGGVYRYAVKAVDAENDPLTYSLAGAPAGMTIDRVGLIRWQTAAADLGAKSFTVVVTDDYGQSASQIVPLVVVADTEVPKVSISVVRGSVTRNGVPNIDLNSRYLVQVTATDNVGVDRLSLKIAGMEKPLDASGRVELTGSELGNVDLMATATDFAANVGSTMLTVKVVDAASNNLDPNDTSLPTRGNSDPTDTKAPLVKILTPEIGSSVTNVTTITGTVDDPENHLWYWRLMYARADQVSTDSFDLADPDWVVIKTSTTEDVNGELGNFDPTSLARDGYVIALVGFDNNGQGYIDATVVGVEGSLQLGNFHLEFTDLTLPLAGIPITIGRVYDTLNSKDEGDFGYGWTLGVQDARIVEIGAIGQGGVNDAGNAQFVPGKTKVYLTNPDGKRVGFTYEETYESGAAFLIGCRFGCSYTPSFKPDPGVYDTLEIDTKTVSRGNLIEVFTSGINPDQYTLTTKDGTRYRYDQFEGLQKITDRSGNTVTFTDSGIVHSSGASIEFVRDNRNRITEIIDPAGNGIDYTYDLRGDLIKVVDRVMAETDFTYLSSPAHYLDAYIDELGRMASRNEYDSEGRIVATITSDGKRIELGHDVAGGVETVRDLKGLPTTYIYDDRGNITRIVNALGEETKFTVDQDGNVLTETNGENETVAKSYDQRGNVLARTDNLGNTTTYTYESNYLASATDPRGGVYAYEYDSKGNLLSDTDPNGNSRTFSYDSKGNLVSASDRIGNVTKFEYDQSGRKTAEIDAMGHRTEYTYDSLGNRTSSTRQRTDSAGVVHALTSQSQYDAEGRPTLVRDVMGNVSTFTYRADGLVEKATDIRGVTANYAYDARGNVTRTDYSDGSFETSEYDANGNLLVQRRRDGTVTTNSYDDANRQKVVVDQFGSTTSFGYDKAGRQVSIDSAGTTATLKHDSGQVFSLSPLGNSAVADRPRISQVDLEDGEYIVDLQYDANGNITNVTSSDGKELTTTFSGTNVPTSFVSGVDTSSAVALDPNGQPAGNTDPNGVKYVYAKDAAGRIIVVTDPFGNQTKFTYDEVGNKLSQTDAEGRTTHWHYDDAGHTTKRILPGGQSESFEYNSVGDLLAHVNFNGQRTEYLYDLQGRVTKKSSASDGRVFEFSYENAGRLTSVIDARGATSFAYDAFGRVLRIDNPDGTFISYGYDNRGNRISLTTASGTVSYAYDNLNRLLSVRDVDLSMTTYAYDMNARTTTISHPNGTTSTFLLDTSDRIATIVHRDPQGAAFARYDVQYETVLNNQRTITELNGRVVSYTYDSLHRLVKEQITDPVNGNESFSYTYDRVGNRLSKTDLSGTILYSYDVNDRLLTAGSVTYAYDANGNVVAKEEAMGTTSYTFNSDDQLVRISLPDSSIVTYEYDFEGARLSETTDGVKTSFLVDKQPQLKRVIEESNSARTVTNRYLYGDRLLSQTSDKFTVTVHSDVVGSTTAITNSSGQLQGKSAYDAFGEPLMNTEEFAYGYLAEPTNKSSGLTYLRARYVDSGTGRFVSIDPINAGPYDPRALNSYVYANADPTSFQDPTGESAIEYGLFAGGIASIAEAYSALGGFVSSIFGAVGNIIGGIGPTHSVESRTLNVATPPFPIYLGISGGIGLSSSFEILSPLTGPKVPLTYFSIGFFTSFTFGAGVPGSLARNNGTAFGVNLTGESYEGGFNEGSLSIFGNIFIDIAVSGMPFIPGEGAVSISTGKSFPPVVGLDITYAWRYYAKL